MIAYNNIIEMNIPLYQFTICNIFIINSVRFFNSIKILGSIN